MLPHLPHSECEGETALGTAIAAPELLHTSLHHRFSTLPCFSAMQLHCAIATMPSLQASLLLVAAALLAAPAPAAAQHGGSLRHERQLLTSNAAATASATPGNSTAANVTQATLEYVYQLTITDAATIDPGEIKPLNALGPIAPNGTVLVVAWTRFPSTFVPGATLQWAFDPLFVALPWEASAKCASFPRSQPGALQLRLEQMFGLPPLGAGGARRFVVLRVNASDIFRPCGNPSTTAPNCTSVIPPNVPESHYVFYARFSATAYTHPSGFPWTRLGYTFDWSATLAGVLNATASDDDACTAVSDFEAARQAREYGVSEYVVPTGTTVQVVSNLANEDFCAAPVPV